MGAKTLAETGKFILNKIRRFDDKIEKVRKELIVLANARLVCIWTLPRCNLLLYVAVLCTADTSQITMVYS